MHSTPIRIDVLVKRPKKYFWEGSFFVLNITEEFIIVLLLPLPKPINLRMNVLKRFHYFSKPNTSTSPIPPDTLSTHTVLSLLRPRRKAPNSSLNMAYASRTNSTQRDNSVLITTEFITHPTPDDLSPFDFPLSSLDPSSSPDIEGFSTPRSIDFSSLIQRGVFSAV